jgi:membrane-associated progesterone receptor component
MDSETKNATITDSETKNATITEQVIVLFQRLIHDIYTSPINLILVILIIFLLIKLFLLKRKPISHSTPTKAPPQLPKMAKQDLTIEQLRGYNGTDSNGRILTVIYGDIFDVSRRSDLYGPGKKF